MITSSPGFTVAISALYRTCLPPVPTVTSEVCVVMLFSRLNLSTIACFNSGIPSTAVYLVLPSAMARAAASLTWSGVSKSGSPAPEPITSWPAALSSAALVETAIVGDGLIRDSLSAKHR